jgi:cation diffusion facilitator family transporter
MADPHGEGGTRAILAAFFANLGIALAKFVGFLITRSSAMLAESIHSLADTGNQALLLLGARRARRAPTPAHPFGYGRERYFWAFVVALVLFSLGSLFALYEGIEKLRHPHEIDSPAVAIAILGVAVALEGYSFRTAVHAASPLREGAGWWQFIRNAKAPELPVVLLEDLGALLGLAVALTAVTVSLVTDNPRWDGAGTVVIGLLLGAIAIVLAIEMRSLLIGESASATDRQAILDAIDASPESDRLIHLRTEHLGPDELLVAAKIAFPPDRTFDQVAAAIDTLEVAIRDRVPAARVIYIEPDVDRTPATATKDLAQTPEEGASP